MRYLDHLASLQADLNAGVISHLPTKLVVQQDVMMEIYEEQDEDVKGMLRSIIKPVLSAMLKAMMVMVTVTAMAPMLHPG